MLAFATFASVRSAHRATRVAEQSLLEARRPILLPSRPQDVEQKIGFSDDLWVKLAGGHGHAKVTDDAIYLVIAVRNVGNGLACSTAGRSLRARRSAGPALPTRATSAG